MLRVCCPPGAAICGMDSAGIAVCEQRRTYLIVLGCLCSLYLVVPAWHSLRWKNQMVPRTRDDTRRKERESSLMYPRAATWYPHLWWNGSTHEEQRRRLSKSEFLLVFSGVEVTFRRKALLVERFVRSS